MRPLLSLDQLREMLGKGDQFISQDLQSNTLFGGYRVDGAVMQVSGYNEYLSRLTKRISQALSTPLPKNASNTKISTHHATPYLQVHTAALTGWLDDYIWLYLFNQEFNPTGGTAKGDNWRVLLLQPVLEHIVRMFSVALLESEEQHQTGQTDVRYRKLSEVLRLQMRESLAIKVSKCIYSHQSYPAQSGGLEKAFIHWAQADGRVQAFCKIHEQRHDYARLRYVKEDGLPAFYSPDFLLRSDSSVYLVETKAQAQTTHPNVQRKLKAAAAWCERINALEPDLRDGKAWHYVLLGEADFYEWQSKNATLIELLDYARIRPQLVQSEQSRLL